MIQVQVLKHKNQYFLIDNLNYTIFIRKNINLKSFGFFHCDFVS